MTTIEILADRVWAGKGKLVNGVIEDCAAILGGSQDAAEAAYEEIERAIEDGRDVAIVDGVRYTWTIERVAPETMRQARRDGYVTIGEFGLPPSAGYIVATKDQADAVRAAYDAIVEGDLGDDVLDDVLEAGGLYLTEE